MQKKRLKSEKGAITLFVLLSILFFLIVVFSVFINSNNKRQSQTAEIDKIKSEYEKEIDIIDDIYDEVVSEELIQIDFDKNGDTYNIAKDGTVDISSNIIITYENGMTMRSREYGWSNSNEQEPSVWTSFATDTINVKNEDVGQGSYYLWVRVENIKDITNTLVSNVFQVNENEIGLSKSNDEYTTSSVNVIIDYKDTYVSDKKVGIGRTLDEATKNSVANENTTIEVTENSFVYVTAKDAYGNISSNYIEINNIDTQPPVITVTPNGKEYIVKNGETTQIDVKVSVEDKISGVKEVKYYWSTSNTEKPTEDKYIVTANNSTVSSSKVGHGTYYLWVKATDNVGNVREEPSYAYIVKPPLAPNIALKHNDENGKEYISGTWTNQDVYHEISLPTTEGTVEKYQYSNDGITWKDINGELKQGKLDYTTNFPIVSENRPNWLGEVTANGTYYFDINETNGTLTSAGTHGNKGKNSTTANSYIPIDLREYTEEDKLTITLNYTISSEGVSYDIGYATITQTTTAPAYNSSTNQFIKVGGSLTTSEKSITISGGKLYYLHLGYRKDSSTSSGNDSFVINNIKLTSETLGKNVSFYNYNKNENIITYIVQDEINSNFYIKANYEDKTESGISEFKIQIDKTAPIIGTITPELISETKIKLTISNIIENASGLKGYYISTEETAPTIESNWTDVTEDTFEINNLNTGTKYYIWLIDNANNISEVKSIDEININYRIDNSKYAETLEQALSLANNNSTIELLNDYTDESTVNINKNIILNTQDYTLTRTKTITIASGTEAKPIIFELNGNITSSSNINTLTINNYATIQGTGIIESTSTSSSYRAIYNTGVLTQNGDLTISGYYRGIYNTNIFTLNSGKVESTYNNNSAYAIYNYSSGDIVNINGGEVSGYYGLYNNSSATANIKGGKITGTGAYGIYHSSGKLTINDGTIIGNTYGVSISSSGTINMDGGYITGTNGIYISNSSATVNIYGGTIVGSTYGIYGYTTGNKKITIGNLNVEVNDISPVVSGGQYGIYMRNNNTYNFYNGVIMGTNAKPYTSTVIPRQGYMVYTYYDYDNARKYCSTLTPTVQEITIEQIPSNDIWTNKDVTVQIKYPILEGATLQYSENGQDWKDVDNGYIATVLENKKIYARMLDASGIILVTKEHEVKNIDKIAPTITINPETTKYLIYNMDQTEVDITVTVNVSDEGGSQIKTSKYGWSKSIDEEPTQWEELHDGQTITKENNKVGVYYLWFDVSDNAGNISDVNVIRYMVELQEAVVQIVETGEYYYTIQDAIDAVGTTSATIKIIKDTDEVSVIDAGKNITIDLNGYTIGSSTNEQPTITNNGTLTIIDNSENKTGKIENLVGTAIQNDGTLTIGDNTNQIEDNTPTITGKKTGIKNNNILNYYDGTIIGKIAIDGNVHDTIESYGPVGIYREEDGMTVVNLRVISDYVARIEWFYYSTLQSAFNDCIAKPNNTEQTTVNMLKDIVLDNTVTSYNGQNIQLNLNGYMLTNSRNTILDNYGSLEITDLTQEQNGNINSSIAGTSSDSYRLITNMGNLNIAGGKILSQQNYNNLIYNQNGEFKITGGEINNSVTGRYNHNNEVIHNTGTGIINVVEGKIYTTSRYVIYNTGRGKIDINGGEISNDTTNGSIVNHGIYNEGTGTININGGEISTNSLYHTYGIYNKSTGIINITGGKISTRTKYNDNYENYGIYSEGTGTINVSGGEIISVRGKNIYGVKASTGIVNISGGKISVDAEDDFNNGNYGIYSEGKGIINVEGGEIISSGERNVYGIRGEGTININKGKISASVTYSSGSGAGVYNAKTGILNMNGGIISINVSTGTSYGIYNANTGVINIKSGEITNNSSSNIGIGYGVYNSQNGKIVLGREEDNEISNSNIKITTINEPEKNYKNIGIRNNSGELEIYDGIITGNIALSGHITKQKDGYTIKNTITDEIETIYLEKIENEKDIVQVENIKYKTLEEAMQNIDDNKETVIQVIEDFNLEYPLIFSKNIILDLNGHKIDSRYYNMENEGILTIKDTTTEKNGEISFINKCLNISNINNGILNIESGNIIMNSYEFNYGIYNNSAETINITGGKINIYSEKKNVFGIFNASTGTININGGEISSNSKVDNSYTIYNKSTGIISINEGNISSNGYSSSGAYNVSTGTISINGGNISSNGKDNSYGTYNASTGTINVNGGEIANTGNTIYGTYNAVEGIININGGKITNTGIHVYGIYNAGKGTINVTEGEINDDSSYDGYMVYNNDTGTINITGGVISGIIIRTRNLDLKPIYGIYNKSTGTIKVTGGEISITTNTNTFGMYNYTGTITIGTKGDGIVSTNEPNIKSIYTGTSTSYKGYGLRNYNGKFNFYDGRIEGSTKAVYEGSEITEVEETQQPQYSADEKIYAYGIEASDIAKIGTKTYTNLQDAINEATGNDIIKILRGVQYTNQDTALVVPNNKIITIDLQNYPIISAIEDVVFTVEGSLKIINTVEGEKAKISNSYKNTIYVKQGGTLETSGVIITSSKANDSVIKNEGTVNVKGGTISKTGGSGYTINNSVTGIVNIYSGTVSSNNYSIYNIGEVNIIQGTITGGNNVITNNESGILNIENGTIRGSATVIANQGNSSINMTGGNIVTSNSSNTQYGINNTSTGNVNITGGNISCTYTGTSSYNAYGIYSTAGTVNIGTKDGNIKQDIPSILGTTNGIYTDKNCNLNIYDGIIKGINSAINGNITSIEEKSEIVIGKETYNNKEYETISLVKIDSPIASVGGVEYYSLKEAFNSITETGTINILRTGTVAETIDISTGKDITVDLNGNTLNIYTKINNNGTLKITDTSANTSGILTGYKDRVIDNAGTFELLNGTISGMTYGIYNNKNGVANISGGTLRDNTYGVYNISGGIVNVTNGTITSNTYGSFNYGGTTNISGGNININDYGVYNSSGTTRISGTSTNISENEQGVYNVNGTIDISDTTITGNKSGVNNKGTGTINILSGNILSDTIAVTNTSTGRINIGNQDANVNKENPVIQGEQYGIANTGTGAIGFYDGIVKGKEGTIKGYYLYTEIGYKAQTNVVEGYYCDTLALSGTVTTVAKIGEIEYTNLQSAINACSSDTPMTITLLNSINSSNMFTIEKEQNVIIDLGGYTITTGVLDNLIENMGSLTIIDSRNTGMSRIVNNSGIAINNTGTLNLGQDDGTVSKTSPEVYGNSTGIVNTGTFNFYDGIIKGAEALRGNVTARPNGYAINVSTDSATGTQQLTLSK